MRFIVGSNKEENADGSQSVYAIYGEKAVNISQLDPTIGSDLTGLMGQENLKSYIDALTR